MPRPRPVTTTVMSAASTLLLVASCAGPQPTSPRMSMFVTSTALGDGGNLGGLAGADAHCQRLAAAVGSTRTWHAYLSAPADDLAPAVNARDRIGDGPWFNQQGREVAASVDALHSDRAGISYTTALTEQGRPVPRNVHDMLTGSNARGMLSAATSDTTCRGWRSNASGRAMLGHSDGGGASAGTLAWNAAHISDGCSAKALDATGGAGLFYCFAIN